MNASSVSNRSADDNVLPRRDVSVTFELDSDRELREENILSEPVLLRVDTVDRVFCF